MAATYEEQTVTTPEEVISQVWELSYPEEIRKMFNDRIARIKNLDPEIDEIVDYFRDEIWLDYVPEINIVSNMHKNLNDKYDTYDTMMDFLPFDKFLKIYDFESVETISN